MRMKIGDAWFGDVWVAGGQSNMELTMERVATRFPDAGADANYPLIREFRVPRAYAFDEPAEDFASGAWKATTPESVLSSSAVAYYFARELHERVFGAANCTSGLTRPRADRVGTLREDVVEQGRGLLSVGGQVDELAEASSDNARDEERAERRSRLAKLVDGGIGAFNRRRVRLNAHEGEELFDDHVTRSTR